MRLTDKTTLQNLSLPNDLLWANEFEWSAVESTHTYSLSGALIVEQGVKQAGRPINLKAEADMAWVTRAVVSTLHTWAAIPNRIFELGLEYAADTRTFNVIFDNSTTSVIAKPVKGFPGHSAGDYFHVELKLIEV